MLVIGFNGESLLAGKLILALFVCFFALVVSSLSSVNKFSSTFPRLFVSKVSLAIFGAGEDQESLFSERERAVDCVECLPEGEGLPSFDIGRGLMRGEECLF